MIDPALMDKPKRKLKTNPEQTTPLPAIPLEVAQKWPLYAWRVRWQRLRRMLGKRR